MMTENTKTGCCHGDIVALRHSAAHLLAHAISELYPDTKFTLGPPTKDGFFYDVLPVKNFCEDDLAKIHNRMLDIAKRDYPLTHEMISKQAAYELFKDNPFKLELIDGIPEEYVGLAKQGDFYDLCKGGHVARTSQLQHVLLTSISGSYWRADRNNQPLQRISGVVFFTHDDLIAYQQKQIELQQYDHRRLGRQQELFSFHEEGVGFPFFHPKGMTVLNVMTQWMRSLQRYNNYQEVRTPLMLDDSLWRRSGHYAFYSDKMYFSAIDDRTYAIKPMNCPGAMLIYGSRPRSYRELPLKLAEYGTCHRHELSGVLHGLTRVRSFVQDDAHIFCTTAQLEEEVVTVLKMAQQMLEVFGLKEYHCALATRPDEYMGDPAVWNTATQALERAMNRQGISYAIKEKEGAFYGPKIEIVIKDSMDRSWQCGTVQVDFFQPDNFDLTFINSAGVKERPVVIHQAIFGSLERFFAILLEHYKGQLPFFLAPVQVRVLPVTSEQIAYANEIGATLLRLGIRIEVDTAGDPLAGQIKRAKSDKIPWMLIIGKKEVENVTVSLRTHDNEQSNGISVEQLYEKIITIDPLIKERGYRPF